MNASTNRLERPTVNRRKVIYHLKAHLVAATFFLALVQAHAQSFTKVIDGAIIANGGNSLGASWVDIDGDGNLDLYVSSNSSHGNLVYRNDGAGVFTQLTTGAIVNAGAGSFSATWGDIDNDGRVDLFVGRRPGPGLLYHQEADGTFTPRSVATGACFGAAWADYDGDGLLDLIIAHDGSNKLWHNNGGNLIVAPTTGLDVSGDAIAWADYDADGKPDVVIPESSFSGGGPTRLYRGTGVGGFVGAATKTLAPSGTFASCAAWGDFNNDGFLDLFLGRGNSSASLGCLLLMNNGDGSFSPVTDGPVVTDVGNAISASWVDYDNDGWLDLFIADSGGGQNRLYHNIGDGTFESASNPMSAESGSFAGNSWGDYDRDGFPDLFVASNGGGPDLLYHNDGNSNAWLSVKCIGTQSNRSAIGAVVRLKTTINNKILWQMRQISPGDGWAGIPLEAYFGLGDATSVELLQIQWPSGSVQELRDIPAKKYLTITEPPRLRLTLTSNTPQITLRGGRNLQYSLEASGDLASWSAIAKLSSTNLDGTVRFTESYSNSSGPRFYRALLQAN